TGLYSEILKLAGNWERKASHDRSHALVPQARMEPPVISQTELPQGKRVRLPLEVIELDLAQLPVLPSGLDKPQTKVRVLIASSNIDLLEASHVSVKAAIDHEARRRHGRNWTRDIGRWKVT